MKISIITPVYNNGKTIERTILSILNQQCNSQIEYIVIDGGSTDSTLEVINRYAEKIDILISEKDKGVYDAMNKGISLATGDIIGIINSDDWYNDGAFRVVEQTFIQYPEVSIVHSPVHNYVNDKHLSTFIPGNLENLLFRFTIAHPSCFVRKEVYEQIGLFDLNYIMAADYNFVLQAYTTGYKFHCVDTPLASFSLNGMTGQLTNRLKLIKETWQVSSKFVSHYPKNLKHQHRAFYISWLFRELVVMPLKFFDPVIVIKVKGYLRRHFGKFSSDRYGAW
ncbi:MAG: glycosyltransferase family 2 protein [Rhizonema sp. PD38]|nr:glycosyltransferase family 2 protein [Rhizonema sp. PD38]